MYILKIGMSLRELDFRKLRKTHKRQICEPYMQTTNTHTAKIKILFNHWYGFLYKQFLRSVNFVNFHFHGANVIRCESVLSPKTNKGESLSASSHAALYAFQFYSFSCFRFQLPTFYLRLNCVLETAVWIR